MAPHQNKEYIAEAVEKGLNYLSSIQRSDGTFEGWAGEASLQYTLAVLDMMEALNIPLDDERFVKNGYTLADAVQTFYVDNVGFVDRDAELSAEDSAQERAENTQVGPVYDQWKLTTVSALAYLQTAGVGGRSGDNSVFEIVGSALTETPLGAILLAVIVAALLAFGMVRRYRRIKKEQ